jgi:hypothetical protein
MTNRLACLALCAAAAACGGGGSEAVTRTWDQVPEQPAGSIDHSDWRRVLKSQVSRAADGVAVFDYAGVSPRIRASLDRYLADMAALDPRDHARDEQMAYWINLYNALTVDLILNHYPVDSILELGESPAARGPWDDPLISIAGQALTLNDIEHRILRPIWRDPRIHFAVNCASISCPDLSDEPFSGAGLDAALDAAAATYLAHPRAVHFGEDGLLLASIFDWYADDFGEDTGAVLRRLAEWAPPDVAARLRAYDGDVRYRYDWTLNAP